MVYSFTGTLCFLVSLSAGTARRTLLSDSQQNLRDDSQQTCEDQFVQLQAKSEQQKMDEMDEIKKKLTEEYGKWSLCILHSVDTLNHSFIFTREDPKTALGQELYQEIQKKNQNAMDQARRNIDKAKKKVKEETEERVQAAKNKLQQAEERVRHLETDKQSLEYKNAEKNLVIAKMEESVARQNYMDSADNHAKQCQNVLFANNISFTTPSPGSALGDGPYGKNQKVGIAAPGSYDVQGLERTFDPKSSRCFMEEELSSFQARILLAKIIIESKNPERQEVHSVASDNINAFNEDLYLSGSNQEFGIRPFSVLGGMVAATQQTFGLDRQEAERRVRQFVPSLPFSVKGQFCWEFTNRVLVEIHRSHREGTATRGPDEATEEDRNLLLDPALMPTGVIVRNVWEAQKKAYWQMPSPFLCVDPESSETLKKKQEQFDERKNALAELHEWMYITPQEAHDSETGGFYHIQNYGENIDDDYQYEKTPFDNIYSEDDMPQKVNLKDLTKTENENLHFFELGHGILIQDFKEIVLNQDLPEAEAIINAIYTSAQRMKLEGLLWSVITSIVAALRPHASMVGQILKELAFEPPSWWRTIRYWVGTPLELLGWLLVALFGQSTPGRALHLTARHIVWNSVR